MNIVTIHRDPERHAYFAEATPRPIVFEKLIDCWLVTDRRDAQALLRSHDLAVADYCPIYERVGERSGHVFANLQFAFKHMPLCCDGAEHAAARRRLAEFLNSRRSQVAPLIADMVGRRLRPLMTSAEVDLMADVLVPLVGDLIGAITETEITDEAAVRRATIVFDRYIGLRKRIELEDEIRRIREMIVRSHPGLTEDEEGLRVSLFILGHDTLTGTLGESIFRILAAYDGRSLHEMDYPAMPGETAVPFVERVVGRDFEYAGVTFRKDEKVRIRLQPFAYSTDPADRARIFGIGVHACLGRQLALDVWRHLTAGLSQIHAVAKIVSHTMRTEDFVFTVPKSLKVKVTHGVR